MKRILKHALFWVAVFFFYTLTYAQNENYQVSALFNLVNVPLFMVAYYLLAHVQLPLLYHRKRYVWFGLSLLVSTFAIGAACRLAGIYYLDALVDFHDDTFMTLSRYLAKSVRFYTPALAILAVKAHRQHLKEKEQLRKFEQEKIETELKYLKAQLNPHFLFNTLNNLYSFILNNSPQAADMVLRLSEILDYILYKSQAKYVPLNQEIQLIDNYIELEKIRYGKRLTVTFTQDGAPFQQQVAPLLLLSVVENAFKHGASGSIAEPEIRILLEARTEELYFEVWNTKREIEHATLNDAYKTGIGLQNIQRQLNLLYPGQHQLETQDENGFFALQLTLKTQTHALPLHHH